MTSLPASSLVETVANKIKQMILSGSLVNILPGERELGHQVIRRQGNHQKGPGPSGKGCMDCPPTHQGSAAHPENYGRRNG